MEPLVVCVTPTYGRFHLLQEMLWCWLNQTYKNKQLLIVNDQANFTIECDVPGVTVINVPDRFVGLGAKRNFIAKNLPEDAEYVVTMDDDDLFLPGYIEGLVRGLQVDPTYTRSKYKSTFVTMDNSFEFVNTTWPCYGASCFHAKQFRTFWMQDIYVWGEDVDMMRRHAVSTIEVPGNGNFIYRRGMNIVHASEHTGLIYQDMMHQAIVSHRILHGSIQYDEPTTATLKPKIEPASLELYNSIQSMHV